MTNNLVDSSTLSNVGWTLTGTPMQHATDDELATEADEPPDGNHSNDFVPNQFKRTVVRKHADHTESLLTKALHHSEEEEIAEANFNTLPPRRRSMTSNISLASTVDLISDASGVTSPSRSNTPSPPPQVFALDQINAGLFHIKSKTQQPHTPSTISFAKTGPSPAVAASKPKDTTIEGLTKKRCISFACGAKAEPKKVPLPPKSTGASQPTQSVDEKPQRKTCIKFACSAKPDIRNSSSKTKEPSPTVVKTPDSPSTIRAPGSPASARKYRSPSAGRTRSYRSSTPRPSTHIPNTPRSKQYLSANSGDLDRESSRFHEFACDEPQEDDWIRNHYTISGKRLTVNDTLQKENEIRRLGKEVEEEEEEALEEEEEEENGLQEDDDDEDADDDDADQDDAGESFDVGDDISGYGSDNDDISDGYHTDNEVGFAESDDDDDDAEDLQLWNPGQSSILRLSGETPKLRRPSMAGDRSDSSSSSVISNMQSRVRGGSRRVKIRPGTPELPDSTDFVCGTLDEDRALEDAYISCVAARRREKLHLIPQDIDPSFPTSEPEDEEEETNRNKAHDSDDQLWIHGELEDINHEKARGADRRSKQHVSPRRHRSPPPKRTRSPAPKPRGRSPKRLFDRHSPRQIASPVRTGNAVRSPPASLVFAYNQGQRGANTLAFRPGLTQTKSLPRAPALFPGHYKAHRRGKLASSTHDGHVRGAIDIVKGLEQKRQRRREKEREKYFQKHCNMARKGQIHDKRPQPGKGAERMREIGLLMANKKGPTEFVLSV